MFFLESILLESRPYLCANPQPGKYSKMYLYSQESFRSFPKTRENSKNHINNMKSLWSRQEVPWEKQREKVFVWMCICACSHTYPYNDHGFVCSLKCSKELGLLQLCTPIVWTIVNLNYLTLPIIPVSVYLSPIYVYIHVSMYPCMFENMYLSS